MKRSIQQALFVFVLTRLFVLAVFIIASFATLDRSAPEFDQQDPHPVVRVQPTEIWKELNHTLGRGDSGWYMGIAQHGYDRGPFEARPQHNWVFFPLYPLLVRLAGAGTGEYLFFGALLSNALFFGALILLHRLASALGYDEATADRAIFYTAIFPVSYFFSLPVTESLFLCLTVASFLAAAGGRWWVVGVLGALAAATRLNGIFLLPALALFYWQRPEREKWRLDILWLALIPAGLAAFMFFLWKLTGNAMAFTDAIAAWDRKSGSFLMTLYEYVTNPLSVIEPWNFRTLNFAAAILALGAALYWLRRQQWAFATLTLLVILLPLSSSTLQSAARYVSVIFPVFIALAVAGRTARVDQSIRVVFLVLFGLMTFFFAMRFSFASA